MEIKLKAKLRDVKNKVGAKAIPAVLYGPDTDNKTLELNGVEFDKTFAKAGESTLIDLEIEGDKTEKVIIKDIQKHPVKDTIIHADLYKVDMNKKIHTDVHLEFVGESKAVKEKGGVLVKNMDALHIECLPGDLIDHIDADISKLDNLGDSIKLSDLDLPEKITLSIEDMNTSVASVIEPRVEVETVVEEEVPVEGETPATEGETPATEGETSKEEASKEEK